MSSFSTGCVTLNTITEVIMTCRGCGLVKTNETRKFFIINRSTLCRGCDNYKYRGIGYYGKLTEKRHSLPKLAKHRKPPKPYQYKHYKHTSELQGRDYSRERVRIRDNHTCQSCFSKWIKGRRRFDVHHLDGLCGKLSTKYDKIEMMPKLITLCHKCHFNQPTHTLKTRHSAV